jgi:hypothetical protein
VQYTLDPHGFVLDAEENQVRPMDRHPKSHAEVISRWKGEWKVADTHGVRPEFRNETEGAALAVLGDPIANLAEIGDSER